MIFNKKNCGDEDSKNWKRNKQQSNAKVSVIKVISSIFSRVRISVTQLKEFSFFKQFYQSVYLFVDTITSFSLTLIDYYHI